MTSKSSLTLELATNHLSGRCALGALVLAAELFGCAAGSQARAEESTPPNTLRAVSGSERTEPVQTQSNTGMNDASVASADATVFDGFEDAHDGASSWVRG